MADVSDRTLQLELELRIPPDAVWRGWTDPKALVKWFTPAPWRTTRAEIDVRPGGSSLIVMEGPKGEVNEARGVYLEVVPERKLVFTDAFVSAWIPSESPFMVGMIELSRTSDGGTLYRATARHWTVENREAHEKMGFREGWTAAARQLEALFAKS